MKFELNQKLVLKSEPIEITVKSLRSGSQPILMVTNGENYYDVEILGFRTCISEAILDLLAKELVKPVVSCETPLNNIAKESIEKVKKVEKVEKAKKNGLFKSIIDRKKSVKRGR
jgi:hypothetical protein